MKVNIARQDTLEEVLGILRIYAKPVYGFIEHNNILAPDQRIEYLGINANYNPITVTMGDGYSLGDWGEFSWLKENKPYMVNADGTPYKQLKEDDYNFYTDGTASDVANADFNGGAFAWAKKIYKKEYMVGSDRYVLFSDKAQEGFEAVGFIDPDNNELDGVWIPMFYGSIVNSKMRSISGIQPDYNHNTSAQKTAIDAFSIRAKFFGGAIIKTLIDLMIMFAKTTDLQGAYGNGNMSGYDSSLAPTNGVKQNAVVGGGKFFGTSDRKSLNKIFHSIVLGTYQQWMRDPYTVCVNGILKVSKNYAYDLTGASYDVAGADYTVVEDTSWHYPHRYKTVAGFGAVPDFPFKGSTSTGGCDGFVVNRGIVAVGLRFGRCGDGLNNGPRALYLSSAATGAHWVFGAAILLLPPVGVAA